MSERKIWIGRDSYYCVLEYQRYFRLLGLKVNWSYISTFYNIELATKWLRILSLGGIDKIRNHLVANPITSVDINRRTCSLRQLNSRIASRIDSQIDE